MGQYWLPVNLTKKEFIDPHKLASGLKLWEQLANSPGVGAALIVLTAAMPEPRGGGDFDLEESRHGPERKDNEYPFPPSADGYAELARHTIGRWAGDRIAIIGDYAEDGDIRACNPNVRTSHHESEIYGKCRAKTKEVLEDMPRKGKPAWKKDGKFVYYDVVEPPEFKDITDAVCAVIEHELNGKFTGEGWREFKRSGE